MKLKALFLAGVVVLLVACSAKAQSYEGISQPLTPDEELLFKAASTGDLKTINSLLDRNPEIVHAKDPKDGKTALHVASMVGKIKAAELLLNRGSDVNARDRNHNTPYYYARIGRWHKLARLLHSRGGKR